MLFSYVCSFLSIYNMLISKIKISLYSYFETMTSGGAILRHSISKISGEYFIVKFHCSLSQFEQFLTSTKDAIDFASAVPEAYNLLRCFSVL